MWKKVYSVLLDTPLTQEMISGFEAGVCLADGSRMLPALARPGGQGPCSAEVVLRQGVYHQIKRMFGVYGAGVRELRRTAIGGVLLDGTLAPAAGASSPRRSLRFCRPNVHETDKKFSHLPCTIGFQRGA